MSGRDNFANAENLAWWARITLDADRHEIRRELIGWRNRTCAPLSDLALTLVASHIAAAPVDPQHAAERTLERAA
jgi:hypothetical protein